MDGEEAPLGALNLAEYAPAGARTVDCYRRIRKIGEGTYGEVFEAVDIITGERAALKKIKLDDGKEGFPRQILREIKLLKKLDHENIIRLKEIVVSPGSAHGTGGSDDHIYRGDIYMVFEYMDHDLKKVLHHSAPSQVKVYMGQLLKGLQYCHANNVLHRDIKGANLLITGGKLLKLADFGLARLFTRDGTLTNHVITLWYRPPELLLGATSYAEPVDIWSVGCIFAEFLLKKPLFPGRTELSKIFELCGSPNEESWPGVSKLPLYKTMTIRPATPTKRSLRDILQNFDCPAVELIERMLILNPSQRISAQDALGAAYFIN
ncbi:cell division cycle 2-related protein kinase 7 isoform X2 [Zea mays]|uniref:cell division cycle 2-related protein kinase 7 isoform X2 n=1 Tax=Zea mays TaxID=4577 RepID=UPI0004DEB340|nr:cell division cycle 2-related protein kinase 7 isoform X2 [Zea mays]|eukprot:XP_008677342.1 cell division cycle 2-related protein kinase 7 isoform X2 [Zea mays]